MKPNRIYITGLFLSVFLSGKAQRIEELPAVPLQIGYEKTLHLIFPTEVKYYSIGGDYVIGEKVGNCPEIIRLKAAEENFPGETTLSVVTADTKFYSYAISYNAHPVESYVRVDGQAPAPHTLPVGKDRQMFLIFPAGITYVDYGSTNVEVEKAEGVDNILAVKATGEFTEDTNISAVVEVIRSSRMSPSMKMFPTSNSMPAFLSFSPRSRGILFEIACLILSFCSLDRSLSSRMATLCVFSLSMTKLKRSGKGA